MIRAFVSGNSPRSDLSQARQIHPYTELAPSLLFFVFTETEYR
jgi:hypothetical protein